MADLASTAMQFVRLYGPLAVAVFAFLESSMLFPFLPSEVVVPAAAAMLVHDVPSLLAFVAAAGAGGTIGAFVPYYAVRGPASGAAARLRDAVRVSESTVDRAQQWFHRWGAASVLWGRFLPGLRSVISIPAGLARMDPRWFGALTAAGTVGFNATVAGVVYVARRRNVVGGVRGVAAEYPVLAALALLVAVAGTLVVTAWYRRTRC